MECRKWMNYRSASAFSPPPWTMVACERDTDRFIPSANTLERRHRFALDRHTGMNWLREGEGVYLRWSIIPSVEQFCPISENPPLHLPLVISMHETKYRGLQLGRTYVQDSQLIWEFWEPYTAVWIRSRKAYISGWLPLSL